MRSSPIAGPDQNLGKCSKLGIVATFVAASFAKSAEAVGEPPESSHGTESALVAATFPQTLQATSVVNCNDLVAKWSPEHQLYIKGDVFLPEDQQRQLTEFLSHHRNWTVALFDNAQNESFQDDSKGGMSGYAAIENCVGKGLAGNSQFAGLRDSRTNEPNGCILLICFDPDASQRLVGYFANDAYDKRGLGEAHWQGNLDQTAISELKQGRQTFRAVTETITDIDNKLTDSLTPFWNGARETEAISGIAGLALLTLGVRRRIKTQEQTDEYRDAQREWDRDIRGFKNEAAKIDQRFVKVVSLVPAPQGATARLIQNAERAIHRAEALRTTYIESTNGLNQRMGNWGLRIFSNSPYTQMNAFTANKKAPAKSDEATPSKKTLVLSHKTAVDEANEAIVEVAAAHMQASKLCTGIDQLLGKLATTRRQDGLFSAGGLVRVALPAEHEIAISIKSLAAVDPVGAIMHAEAAAARLTELQKLALLTNQLREKSTEWNIGIEELAAFGHDTALMKKNLGSIAERIEEAAQCRDLEALPEKIAAAIRQSRSYSETIDLILVAGKQLPAIRQEQQRTQNEITKLYAKAAVTTKEADILKEHEISPVAQLEIAIKLEDTLSNAIRTFDGSLARETAARMSAFVTAAHDAVKQSAEAFQKFDSLSSSLATISTRLTAEAQNISARILAILEKYPTSILEHADGVEAHSIATLPLVIGTDANELPAITADAETLLRSGKPLAAVKHLEIAEAAQTNLMRLQNRLAEIEKEIPQREADAQSRFKKIGERFAKLHAESETFIVPKKLAEMFSSEIREFADDHAMFDSKRRDIILLARRLDERDRSVSKLEQLFAENKEAFNKIKKLNPVVESLQSKLAALTDSSRAGRYRAQHSRQQLEDVTVKRNQLDHAMSEISSGARDWTSQYALLMIMQSQLESAHGHVQHVYVPSESSYSPSSSSDSYQSMSSMTTSFDAGMSSTSFSSDSGFSSSSF